MRSLISQQQEVTPNKWRQHFLYSFMRKLFPLILLLSVLATACSNTKPMAGTTKVIAHRGASGYAPENTMASIYKALEMNADYVEIDVHLSKDGKVMVIHDKDLNRTTTGSGLVADHTLEELKQLDAGSWYSEEFAGEQIPTLSEVIAATNGKSVLLIELKIGNVEYEGIEEKIDSIIKAHSAEGWCEIQSFYDHFLEGFIALQPNYKVHKLIVGKIPFLPIYFDHKWRFGALMHWKNKVAGINPNHKFASFRFVNRLHKNGYTCFTWTVNKPEQMKALQLKGIDGLITNYPDLAP